MSEKVNKSIWLVNQYAVPTSMPGITRHFELVKEWQSDCDFDITIWLSNFNYSLRRFLTSDEIREISHAHKSVSLVWTWAFQHKLNNWKRMLNMLSFTFLFFFKALFKKKPDLVIASSPQLFVTYAALKISRLFNKKFVLEIRDLWPGSLIAMGGIKPGLVLTILLNIEKELYSKSDHIVVLTAHQKTYLLDKGIKKEKITLIPNGVLTDEWEKPGSAILASYRKTLGIKEGDFVAIYTGAHGTANALEQLIEAGKYLNKDEFIILIGDGPEKERLRSLKQSLEVTQVLFLDPVPKKEILNITSIANCGLISLENNEVFRGARPNKLFDYMFLGIPILSTIGGEVEYILNDNNVGFCAESGNAKDIVSKLRKIKFLSANELSIVKDNGMRYIKNEGDRKVSAKLFLSTINNIINENCNANQIIV